MPLPHTPGGIQRPYCSGTNPPSNVAAAASGPSTAWAASMSSPKSATRRFCQSADGFARPVFSWMYADLGKKEGSAVETDPVRTPCQSACVSASNCAVSAAGNWVVCGSVPGSVVVVVVVVVVVGVGGGAGGGGRPAGAGWGVRCGARPVGPVGLVARTTPVAADASSTSTATPNTARGTLRGPFSIESSDSHKAPAGRP